jgi:hypothetical protein
MSLQELARNDWIRAATLAHMVLSQSLCDERLDQLVRPTAIPSAQKLRAA